MAGFILGEKSKQTSMFSQEGARIPVTIISTSPCYLVDFLPDQTNTGWAMSVKLGFGNAKHINKPTRGQLQKAGIKTPLRFLREFRMDKLGIEASIIEEKGKRGIQIGEKKMFVGEEVKPADIFTVGEMVSVSGTSKGKGFQGVVKRHGFAGGPKTHGQSDRHRAPGSIGMTTTPGRVFKGKKMAGRMGSDRTTIQGLAVMAADETSLTVKGLIPGSIRGLVEVRAKGTN